MKINYVVVTAKVEFGLKERLKVLSAKTGLNMQVLLNDFLKTGLEKMEKETSQKDE